MSSTTTNLGLVKMASGETIGQWSDANNGSGANLDKIDTAIGNLNSHIGQYTDTAASNISDLVLAKFNYVKSQGNGIYLLSGGWASNDFGYSVVWVQSTTRGIVDFYASGVIYHAYINNSAVSSVKRMIDDTAKQVKYYTYNYTIAANSSLSITVEDMGMDSPPAGYTPVAIAYFNTANVNVLARGVNVTETTASNNCVWLQNMANSQQTGTMNIGILYLKF